MGMFTKPNPFIKFVVWVLSSFGVAVVADGGNDDYPTTRGYATVQAAIDAGATFILVAPGTYAENIAPANGGRVILLGATVGTGGGAAATAPAGGSATIGGWGTLSATAAISAVAGAYLVLGPGITVSGTVTGVYRVGRSWYLPSGAAIATYIPADGSVVAVSVGDRMYYGTAQVWTKATLCGATMRWLGDSLAISIQTTISASATYQIGYQIPAAATGMWLEEWEGNLYVAAPNEAAHRWVITIYAAGVLLDTFDTWNTLAMNPAGMYKMRRALASYAAIVAGGTRVLVGSVSWDYLSRVKAGTPGTLFGSLSVAWRPVFA